VTLSVLALTAAVVFAYQCHKARQREHQWRQEALLARAFLERLEAHRDALALGLLADSFVELGQLSYYDAEEWER
jgi:predicted nucleic acid-binding protein